MQSSRIKKVGLFAVMLLLTAIIGGWAWQMRYAALGDAGPVMTAEKAYAKAAADELVLVDVRRPGEWQESGLPAPAHAITMHQDRAALVRELLAVTGGRRDRELALICATGGRTAWLQVELREAGFTNLINVSEGMFGSRQGSGWIKKGLPLRTWTGPGSRKP